MNEAQLAFMFLGFVFTLFNARVFWGLRKRIYIAFPRHARLITLIVGLLCFALLSPVLAMAIGGLSALRSFRDTTPIGVAIACMTMQFAFWMYGLFLALVSTPADISMRLRQIRRLLKGTSEPIPEKLVDPERRKLLHRSALMAPAAIAVTAGLGALASQADPVVTRVPLRLRNGYGALDGITIAQFSDVHIGSYMSQRRLDVLVNALHALKPDIIVCTGDLIDNHEDQLAPATEFLRRLKAPRGIYMCMGNHEYISAMSTSDAMPENIIKPLRATGVDVLIAQTRKLSINGAHLWLMGTDYPDMRGLPMMMRRSTTQSLDACLSEVRDDGAPRIVLAHTPNQFIEGQKREIDLMLSGHTHGGQISLGRIGDYHFSPVLPFEFYHRGNYERDGRQLYVNSGYGGWLPERINCPPEITLVTLQA
ncbi:UDP-2,3-diacylglucosamine pyrophosphatase LpxG [Planctomycetaceae bacterium]|nr:UDP-2,3-diacylglucosamine pyrophosphatase LpxG [Planctomycetaceae bacterium]